MATLRRWRTSLTVRTLLFCVAASLAWLQVGPAYGLSVSASHEAARREAWRLAHLPHVSLPPGLTQTPDAALQKKIDAKAAASAKPAADVRPLSAQEMGHARGRGAYRNPYFAGAPMPWQRSFRDVNLCDGNLFKSFTDVQVAPSRGAGLVLQRTYNSNDGRVGPFGVGWTHAYDIRMQEAAQVTAESGQPTSPADTNMVPRTDFFGHKHTYHRDADGLYTPPAYLYDVTASDYDPANSPTADTDTGMDGTVKHYVKNGGERDCDSIQDRHGNKTTLAYNPAITLPDGRHPLLSVTDPTGRALAFTWANLGTAAQPAWRITQVQGPLVQGQAVPGVTYRVTYTYYTDPASANAANELYNLKSVTLDPDGLSRTTTYTYTACGPTDSSGHSTGTPEAGLLASVSDPLGHTVSFHYAYNDPRYTDGSIHYMWTNTVWISQVTEPSGNGPHTWSIFSGFNLLLLAGPSPNSSLGTEVTDPFLGNQFNNGTPIGVGLDSSLRATMIIGGDVLEAGYLYTYDSDNNIKEITTDLDGDDNPSVSTYGPHGNLLTHNATYGGPTGNGSYGKIVYPHGTTCAYYNADKYFQKSATTSGRGLSTAMDYYSSQDSSPGNRGEVQWVRDAGYSDPASPSYQKQFSYTYNQYGQKLTETNLRGVVTQYTYGDQWGNLTQVVQDPGAGHLNRTTTMAYDVMGRVLQSTDPSGLTSTFQYNTLGQPLKVITPARGSTPAETISYVYDGNGRTHSVQDSRGTTLMAYQPGTDLVQGVTDPITGTTGYTYGSWGERRTMTLPGGGTWTYTYLVDTNQSGGTQTVLPDDHNLDQAHLRLTSITDDQGRKIDHLMMTHTGALVQTQFNQVYDNSGTLLQYCTVDCGYNGNNTIANPSSPPVGQLDSLRTTYHVADFTGHPGYTRILNQNAYTYDDDLNRKTNTVSVQPANPNGSGQTDASGNPVLTSRTESYAYDDLNRLSAVDYGDGEKQGDPLNPTATPGYTFDPMGNRLSKSDSVAASGTTTTATTASTFDAANRLTSTALNGGTPSAVTSDADGNTLTDAGGRTMTWDSQNRLVSCTKNGVTSTYTYGADGLRRSSTVNGVTTYYAYDGQTMIREMRRSPTTGALVNTATYLQSPRGAEYRRDDTQTEIDSQGRQVSVCRWYVYDGLGSVVGEVDPLGNLTSSPKYDVYGLVRQNPGTASSAMGFVGSLGHLSEAGTGLIYMRARYYDPALGRFNSEDPSHNGNNWFAYCDNNPVNELDQSGKNPFLIAALILAVVGFLAGSIGSILGDYLNGNPINWSNALTQGGVWAAAGLAGGLVAASLAGVGLAGIAIASIVAVTVLIIIFECEEVNLE